LALSLLVGAFIIWQLLFFASVRTCLKIVKFAVHQLRIDNRNRIYLIIKKQRHNEIISQGLLLNNSSSINQYDKKMIETDDDFQGRNDAMQDQVEKEENQGPK
jgi:hypothetical protein